MSKPYNLICIDEVIYWFDILQDNSLDNISKVTGIQRMKVKQILDDRFSRKVIQKSTNHANN